MALRRRLRGESYYNLLTGHHITPLAKRLFTRDGQKSLPLDIELYQHANSLEQGKHNPEFKKKTELALELIDRTLNRGYTPGIVIVDAGYGNNTSFLLELEN